MFVPVKCVLFNSTVGRVSRLRSEIAFENLLDERLKCQFVNVFHLLLTTPVFNCPLFSRDAIILFENSDTAI